MIMLGGGCEQRVAVGSDNVCKIIIQKQYNVNIFISIH